MNTPFKELPFAAGHDWSNICNIVLMTATCVHCKYVRYDMFCAFGAAVLFPLAINVWLKCEKNELSFYFFTLNLAEFKNYKTS